MSVFQAIFSILFQQVVIIRNGGLSPVWRQLIYLMYFIILFRVTAISTSLHFDIAAYFEYDAFHRHALYQSPLRHKQVEYFFYFLPFFSMRLFYVLYLSADSLVWEHIYSLQCWVWQEKVKYHWPGFKCFRPVVNSVSKPSKLFCYPFLEQDLRTKCISKYLRFEMLTTFFCFYSFFITLITFYHVDMKEQFSLIQAVINTIFLLAYLPHGIFFTVINFLAMFTLSLVCQIFVAQYRKVNSNLAKVKTILTTENGDHKQTISSSLKTRSDINAYRTAHIRLTAFILLYNSTTVSKIVSAYFLAILPVHAYFTMLVYFQNRDLDLPIVTNLSISAVVFWLILMQLNLVVARVNSKICQSGPIVGSIFAKKGILEEKREKCKWFNNTGSAWQREALKLSSYYEMIWRNDKELAITAGKTATVNWMFIVNVSLQLKL